jgi:hypothetical protein
MYIHTYMYMLPFLRLKEQKIRGKDGVEQASSTRMNKSVVIIHSFRLPFLPVEGIEEGKKV